MHRFPKMAISQCYKKLKPSKASKDPNTVLTDNYVNLYRKYKSFLPPKNNVNVKIPPKLVYPF